jgi:hypothetical protein
MRNKIKTGHDPGNVNNISINKNFIRSRIEVDVEFENKSPKKHSKPTYMFPYSRISGVLRKLHMPTYGGYYVKPWSRAVELVPREVWVELDNQGYDTSPAKQAYKDKHGELFFEG